MSEEIVTLIKVEVDTDSAVSSTERLTDAQEELKETTDSSTKSTQDYTGALSGMVDHIGVLPKGLAGATKGVIGLTKGMKGLKIAIISTGIGALIIALGALFTYFTKSDEGQKKLAIGMAGLKQVFSVITDVIINLGKNIMWAFENPQKAIKNLWNSIKTNLINRLNGLVESFKIAGKIMQSAIDLDWEGVKQNSEDFGKALTKAVTGVEFDDLKKNIKEVGESFAKANDSVKESIDLQKRRNKLEEEQIKFLTDEAKIRVKISADRLLANDLEKDINDRLNASNDAIMLANKLYDEKIRQKKEEVEILRTQQSLGANTIEDNKELAEKEKELILLSKERTDQLRSLQSVNIRIKNEQKAEVKAEQDRILKEEEEADKRAEAEKERIAGIEEKRQEEIDKRNEKADEQLQNQLLKEQEQTANEIANYIERTRQLIEIENQRFKQQTKDKDLTDKELLVIEKSHQKKINGIKQKGYQQDLAQKKATENAKQQLNQNTVDAFIGLLDVVKGDSKELAITQVLISTAVALIKAWEYGLPIALLSSATIAITSAKSIMDIAKAEDGGLIGGRLHRDGGTLIEAEKGEAIINRRSMADPYLRKLASDINVAGGGIAFAEQGMLVGQSAQLRAINNMSSEVSNSIQQQKTVLVLEDFHSENNRVQVTNDISTL